MIYLLIIFVVSVIIYNKLKFKEDSFVIYKSLVENNYEQRN